MTAKSGSAAKYNDKKVTSKQRKRNNLTISVVAATANSTLRPPSTAVGERDSYSLAGKDPVHAISSLAAELRISDLTKKKAMEIYERTRTQEFARGRSKLALAASCLYAACRNDTADNTITLREVSKASGIDIKATARAYRLLLNKLGLEVTVADPLKFVSIVARRAGLKDDYEKTTAEAVKILKDANLSLAGKNPMGLAATALYMACVRNGKAKKMQKTLARAAGVTEVTIRNRCAELKSVIEGEENSLIENGNEGIASPIYNNIKQSIPTLDEHS
jgi:transcription initiation factor TFIIIB Brf1 subunit/transcription initiation factor TFIIB